MRFGRCKGVRLDVPRVAWTLVLLSLVFGLWAWAGLDPDRWIWGGIYQKRGWFDDWVAVLAAGQAWANGLDPWKIPSPYDPYSRAHVYGSLWFLTGWLGMTVTDVFWSGLAICVGFVLAVARLFDVRDGRSWLFAATALVSAPIMLGINRANNDLFIFMLIFFAAWFAGRRPAGAVWVVMGLLLAASLLKFYPVVALIAVGTLPARPRALVWSVLVTVFVGLGLAIWQWADICRSLSIAPLGMNWLCYDLRMVWKILSQVMDRGPSTSLIEGVAPAFAMVTVLVWRAWSAWWGWLSGCGAKNFMVVASCSIWLGCMFAGPSFAYRAIWLLPIFAVLIRDASVPRSARVASGALGLMFFGVSSLKLLYGELVFRGNLQGESARLISIIGAEQVMVLASMVLCGLVLAGWAWRRSVSSRICFVKSSRAIVLNR